MMRDALERNESCGGHFREEHQTEEGEALRDDENFTFSSAWEYKGEDTPPVLNKEELTFDTVHLTQRSYKQYGDIKLKTKNMETRKPSR